MAIVTIPAFVIAIGAATIKIGQFIKKIYDKAQEYWQKIWRYIKGFGISLATAVTTVATAVGMSPLIAATLGVGIALGFVSGCLIGFKWSLSNRKLDNHAGTIDTVKFKILKWVSKQITNKLNRHSFLFKILIAAIILLSISLVVAGFVIPVGWLAIGFVALSIAGSFLVGIGVGYGLGWWTSRRLTKVSKEDEVSEQLHEELEKLSDEELIEFNVQLDTHLKNGLPCKISTGYGLLKFSEQETLVLSQLAGLKDAVAELDTESTEQIAENIPDIQFYNPTVNLLIQAQKTGEVQGIIKYFGQEKVLLRMHLKQEIAAICQILPYRVQLYTHDGRDKIKVNGQSYELTQSHFVDNIFTLDINNPDLTKRLTTIRELHQHWQDLLLDENELKRCISNQEDLESKSSGLSHHPLNFYHSVTDNMLNRIAVLHLPQLEKTLLSIQTAIHHQKMTQFERYFGHALTIVFAIFILPFTFSAHNENNKSFFKRFKSAYTAAFEQITSFFFFWRRFNLKEIRQMEEDLQIEEHEKLIEQHKGGIAEQMAERLEPIFECGEQHNNHSFEDEKKTPDIIKKPKKLDLKPSWMTYIRNFGTATCAAISLHYYPELVEFAVSALGQERLKDDPDLTYIKWLESFLSNVPGQFHPVNNLIENRDFKDAFVYVFFDQLIALEQADNLFLHQALRNPESLRIETVDQVNAALISNIDLCAWIDRNQEVVQQSLSQLCDRVQALHPAILNQNMEISGDQKQYHHQKNANQNEGQILIHDLRDLKRLITLYSPIKHAFIEVYFDTLNNHDADKLLIPGRHLKITSIEQIDIDKISAKDLLLWINNNKKATVDLIEQLQAAINRMRPNFVEKGITYVIENWLQPLSKYTENFRHAVKQKEFNFDFFYHVLRHDLIQFLGDEPNQRSVVQQIKIIDDCRSAHCFIQAYNRVHTQPTTLLGKILNCSDRSQLPALFNEVFCMPGYGGLIKAAIFQYIKQYDAEAMQDAKEMNDIGEDTLKQLPYTDHTRKFLQDVRHDLIEFSQLLQDCQQFVMDLKQSEYQSTLNKLYQVRCLGPIFKRFYQHQLQDFNDKENIFACFKNFDDGGDMGQFQYANVPYELFLPQTFFQNNHSINLKINAAYKIFLQQQRPGRADEIALHLDPTYPDTIAHYFSEYDLLEENLQFVSSLKDLMDQVLRAILTYKEALQSPQYKQVIDHIKCEIKDTYPLCSEAFIYIIDAIENEVYQPGHTPVMIQYLSQQIQSLSKIQYRHYTVNRHPYDQAIYWFLAMDAVRFKILENFPLLKHHFYMDDDSKESQLVNHDQLSVSLSDPCIRASFLQFLHDGIRCNNNEQQNEIDELVKQIKICLNGKPLSPAITLEYRLKMISLKLEHALFSLHALDQSAINQIKQLILQLALFGSHFDTAKFTTNIQFLEKLFDGSLTVDEIKNGDLAVLDCIDKLLPTSKKIALCQYPGLEDEEESNALKLLKSVYLFYYCKYFRASMGHIDSNIAEINRDQINNIRSVMYALKIQNPLRDMLIEYGYAAFTHIFNGHLNLTIDDDKVNVTHIIMDDREICFRPTRMNLTECLAAMSTAPWMSNFIVHQFRQASLHYDGHDNHLLLMMPPLAIFNLDEEIRGYVKTRFNAICQIRHVPVIIRENERWLLFPEQIDMDEPDVKAFIHSNLGQQVIKNALEILTQKAMQLISVIERDGSIQQYTVQQLIERSPLHSDLKLQLKQLLQQQLINDLKARIDDGNNELFEYILCSDDHQPCTLVQFIQTSIEDSNERQALLDRYQNKVIYILEHQIEHDPWRYMDIGHQPFSIERILSDNTFLANAAIRQQLLQTLALQRMKILQNISYFEDDSKADDDFSMLYQLLYQQKTVSVATFAKLFDPSGNIEQLNDLCCKYIGMLEKVGREALYGLENTAGFQLLLKITDRNNKEAVIGNQLPDCFDQCPPHRFNKRLQGLEILAKQCSSNFEVVCKNILAYLQINDAISAAIKLHYMRLRNEFSQCQLWRNEDIISELNGKEREGQKIHYNNLLVQAIQQVREKSATYKRNHLYPYFLKEQFLYIIEAFSRVRTEVSIAKNMQSLRRQIIVAYTTSNLEFALNLVMKLFKNVQLTGKLTQDQGSYLLSQIYNDVIAMIQGAISIQVSMNEMFSGTVHIKNWLTNADKIVETFPHLAYLSGGSIPFLNLLMLLKSPENHVRQRCFDELQQNLFIENTTNTENLLLKAYNTAGKKISKIIDQNTYTKNRLIDILKCLQSSQIPSSSNYLILTVLIQCIEEMGVDSELLRLTQMIERFDNINIKDKQKVICDLLKKVHQIINKQYTDQQFLYKCIAYVKKHQHIYLDNIKSCQQDIYTFAKHLIMRTDSSQTFDFIIDKKKIQQFKADIDQLKQSSPDAIQLTLKNFELELARVECGEQAYLMQSRDKVAHLMCLSDEHRSTICEKLQTMIKFQHNNRLLQCQLHSMIDALSERSLIISEKYRQTLEASDKLVIALESINRYIQILDSKTFPALNMDLNIEEQLSNIKQIFGSKLLESEIIPNICQKINLIQGGGALVGAAIAKVLRSEPSTFNINIADLEDKMQSHIRLASFLDDFNFLCKPFFLMNGSCLKRLSQTLQRMNVILPRMCQVDEIKDYLIQQIRCGGLPDTIKDRFVHQIEAGKQFNLEQLLHCISAVTPPTTQACLTRLKTIEESLRGGETLRKKVNFSSCYYLFSRDQLDDIKIELSTIEFRSVDPDAHKIENQLLAILDAALSHHDAIMVDKLIAECQTVIDTIWEGSNNALSQIFEAAKAPCYREVIKNAYYLSKAREVSLKHYLISEINHKTCEMVLNHLNKKLDAVEDDVDCASKIKVPCEIDLFSACKNGYHQDETLVEANRKVISNALTYPLSPSYLPEMIKYIESISIQQVIQLKRNLLNGFERNEKAQGSVFNQMMMCLLAASNHKAPYNFKQYPSLFKRDHPLSLGQMSLNDQSVFKQNNVV